jgi:hypothetical protein
MPPVWKGTAGASAGWYRPNDADSLSILFNVGLMKDLLSPIAGAAALGIEGYGGLRGANALDGGGRALFMIPIFHVAGGVDYNIRDDQWSALFRLELPMRRSGIFGRGTRLRFDWLPGRGNTFFVGISAPLWGRNIGKTRPQRDSFELERPPVQRITATDYPAALDEALANIREGSRWIARLSMPVLDHGGKNAEQAYTPDFDELQDHIAGTGDRFPEGRTLNEEIRAFHDELDRAFSIAITGQTLSVGQSSEEGRLISEAARRILMDEVLLPYNHLLGQRKAYDAIAEFAAAGHAEFARWMLNHPELPDERYREIFYVFQSLTEMAEEVRALLLDRWEDSRLVWLPLQLTLRPEDHDTRDELNDIIERATGETFTRGNRVWYTMNEEFQLEFARSVREAEDYHVLWIHDYRGFNAQKSPDEVAFNQTVEAYLSSLTRRVREYDETGKIPQYFIFLDQNYFEANNTRLYFRVLLDPMNYDLDLPGGYEEWEQRLREAQADLRDAVASSRLLQAERSQYGDDWLQNRIKVHVSITNPSDFSFLSFHVAGIAPVPDNVIRDHRKIAFYDITEEDPYKGLAMYTGMGVGEHYAGRNWEDRAIMIQGPSALSVKDAARRLLETQGFEPHEIPFPLRAKPKADNYQDRIDAMVRTMNAVAPGHDGQALELHNETGYAPKPINVQKAILYSLMPAGSLLKVPDSLWQSYLYGSLLAGSALRGCKVIVIAPTLASAPSAAAPTMARAHGLLSSLVLFQNQMEEAVRAEGGLFRVLLYSPKVGVGDLAGRIKQAQDNQVPWLRDVYPLNVAARAATDSVEAVLEAAGFQADYLVNADSTDSPKLHLKANFFITGPTWDYVMRRPEWGPLIREYLKYLAAQTGPVDQRPSARETPAALQDAALAMAQGISADVPAELREHSFAYLTVGSTNMNYRSMVMDGEVQITVLGWDTLTGLIDFIFIAGLSEWVEDLDKLDELLPPPGGMTRSLANFIRLML